MKTLLTKERYEATFKKLMKKTFVVSIIFHILVFLPMYVTSKAEKKRLYYAPVYTVNIVSPVRPAKKAKPKPKPRTRPKPKLKPKPKAKPKLNQKTVPTLAKKVHLEEKKAEDTKIDTEKTLHDTLAKLREDVAKREKMDETLKKLEEQVEKREGTENEKAPSDVAEEVKPSEVKGFGRLTRNQLNVTEKKYYNLIWKRIKEKWVLPSGISKKDKDIVTIIVIRIEKDGHVSKIDIEESSGISYYDQSAIRAIKKAEPFPAIAEEINRDFFLIGIRFRPQD